MGNDRSSAIAARVLAFRRQRCEILPREIFSEPAWDLLLDLFVADAAGRRVTARHVSERSDVSNAVMSRWVKYLAQAGLIIGDGEGDLDDELTLSGKAFEAIERMMSKASVFSDAVG
jgi:hypothetical protein